MKERLRWLVQILDLILRVVIILLLIQILQLVKQLMLF